MVTCKGNIEKWSKNQAMAHGQARNKNLPQALGRQDCLDESGKQSLIDLERFKPGFHWVKDRQFRPISVQCVYNIYRARMGRKTGDVG